MKLPTIIITIIFSCQVCFAVKFINYTNKNCIKDIAFHNDTVWLATTGGVVKRDINGNMLASYTTADGLVDNIIYEIAIDKDGNKWFGSSVGVIIFDGINWTTYDTSDGLANNEVYEITIDSDGNKWFATYGGGVSKFDGTNWITYDTSDGLAHNYVHSIAIDNDGNKWFATYGGGVSKFDGINWTTYDTSNGLVDNSIQAIAIDSDGNSWFGSGFKGVSKFDGANWTTYDTSNGLTHIRVESIAIDSEGIKWFCTWGGGVSRFDGTNWKTYTTSDGLAHNYVHGIAIDSNNNKWFGTYCGVSLLVDSSTGIIDGNNLPPHSYYDFSVYPSGKNLVIRYKNKTPSKVSLFLYDLLGKCIYQLSEDKPAGKQSIKVNTESISSGSYICRIKTADGVSANKKVMIMR